MKRELMTTLMVAVAGCTLFLAACDRTVETKSQSKQGPDGTTVKTETTVQHPDGTVTVDKEAHTTTPK